MREHGQGARGRLSMDTRAIQRRAWIVLGEDNAAPVAAALCAAGWQVPRLLQGVEACAALLREAVELPDVIVCGLHFEDGDGLQLTRLLGALAHPPAVYFASLQQRAVIKAAISLAAACRVRVAGYCESPDDAGVIVSDLASYSSPPPAKPRAPLPQLSRQEASELLRQGRLEGWVQPKMRLATSEVVGFECLMRARGECLAIVISAHEVGRDRQPLEIFGVERRLAIGRLQQPIRFGPHPLLECLPPTVHCREVRHAVC